MSQYKLFKVVVENSVAKVWDKAKDEWRFEQMHEVNEPSTCVCDHFPIIEVCTIRNVLNKNALEVGNCCIKKFMPEEGKFFAPLKRIKQDITKSVGLSVLDRVLADGVINGRDYEFYSDTVRKRVLSDKQIKWRVSINTKIIKRYT